VKLQLGYVEWVAANSRLGMVSIWARLGLGLIFYDVKNVTKLLQSLLSDSLTCLSEIVGRPLASNSNTGI
jgi:hypothetical protein